MQELEKILEEIEQAKREPWYRLSNYDVKHKLDGAINRIIDIIRKHMNDGWIPVEERLPEERENPVSQDFYEYQVTMNFGFGAGVRHCKFGDGHWWNGPGIVDEYVIAWKENAEPYRPERSDRHD